MTVGSPTICGATWVAFCGSPSVSNCLSVDLAARVGLVVLVDGHIGAVQDVQAQRRVGPVSAPAIAMVVPAAQVALPLPAGLTGCAAFDVDLCCLPCRSAAGPDRQGTVVASAPELAVRTAETLAAAWLNCCAVRGLGATGRQRQGRDGHQDDGGSHRTSMHEPPPKILVHRAHSGASTTPTRGNLSHGWRNPWHRVPRNQNATRRT